MSGGVSVFSRRWADVLRDVAAAGAARGRYIRDEAPRKVFFFFFPSGWKKSGDEDFCSLWVSLSQISSPRCVEVGPVAGRIAPLCKNRVFSPVDGFASADTIPDVWKGTYSHPDAFTVVRPSHDHSANGSFTGYLTLVVGRSSDHRLCSSKEWTLQTIVVTMTKHETSHVA